jgi:hypothetical protein
MSPNQGEICLKKIRYVRQASTHHFQLYCDIECFIPSYDSPALPFLCFDSTNVGEMLLWGAQEVEKYFWEFGARVE